jgi:hypothetical protein
MMEVVNLFLQKKLETTLNWFSTNTKRWTIIFGAGSSLSILSNNFSRIISTAFSTAFVTNLLAAD